jgi:hypothetical protein
MQLRPGVRLTDAIDRLTEIIQDIDANRDDKWINTEPLNIASSLALERSYNYFGWCLRYERTLGRVFSERDLDELIHSPRYWHIQGEPNHPWSANLVELELRSLLERFQVALDHLKLFRPLENRTGHPMMLDTSVWFGYGPLHDKQQRGDGKEVTQADWCQITGAPSGTDLWLVVPVVTLDELDQLTHKRDTRKPNRPREARNSIRPFLTTLLGSQPASVGSNRPWMTADILPDPPGHRQNEDRDTELLMRAQFLYQIIGRPVTVVTADQGMEVRGGAMSLLDPGRVKVVEMPEKFRLPD